MGVSSARPGRTAARLVGQGLLALPVHPEEVAGGSEEQGSRGVPMAWEPSPLHAAARWWPWLATWAPVGGAEAGCPGPRLRSPPHLCAQLQTGPGASGHPAHFSINGLVVLCMEKALLDRLEGKPSNPSGLLIMTGRKGLTLLLRKELGVAWGDKPPVLLCPAEELGTSGPQMLRVLDFAWAGQPGF